MPQDAFHIKRTAEELNRLLVGGNVNRITQANKDELTLTVYANGTTVKLVVNTNASNARVCLSLTEKEPMPVAPSFCMLLRKHLQGAKITAITQRGFERIVEIEFFCSSDFSQCSRTLVCEIMGKYSNVILVEKGVILGALKTTSLSNDASRALLTGAKYVYPAPQDKLSPFDGAGIRSRLQSFAKLHADGYDEEDLSRFVFENVAGLALPTARQLVLRAGTENGSLYTALCDGAKTPLWSFIGAFFDGEPCLAHTANKNGEITDFFAFHIDGGTPAPSLCKAQDLYYTQRENKGAFENKKRRLESGVRALKKKAAKRLQDTLEKLQEAENAEINRIKGELLTANLHTIEKGAEYAIVDNWYSPNFEKIKIKLDGALSPAKNAQKYFKAYAKQKRAKEVLVPMQETEEKELAYAESILSAIALAEEQNDLAEIETELISLGLLRAPQTQKKNKKEMEIPFREYEKDGFIIRVGRNNLQNDRLLRLATGEDIWLHAQKYHSSHVIIFTEGRQVRDETLLFAAELCAYYSGGRDADKLPIDYCKRKFVKKPNKSKAGFVVYTDYKTVLVKPTKHG